MNIRFNRCPDGEVYGYVTDAETLAKCGKDGDEVAIDVFAKTAPKEVESAVTAIGALVDINSGDYTICNAIEWLATEIYNMGRAKGKEETLADIDALAARIAEKLSTRENG